jgi:hypothetical protein
MSGPRPVQIINCRAWSFHMRPPGTFGPEEAPGACSLSNWPWYMDYSARALQPRFRAGSTCAFVTEPLPEPPPGTITIPSHTIPLPPLEPPVALGILRSYGVSPNTISRVR